MTYSEIDWFLTWKLFHREFFCIYVAVSVPIRLILARGFNTTSQGRGILYIAVSSITLSLASAWFPVIPIVVGAIALAGHPGGVSLLISAPLIAVSLAVETYFIDLILVRLFLRPVENRRYAAVLVANIVNAICAVTLGLAWAIHHMPTFEAALN